jgi:hypothetical protein
MSTSNNETSEIGERWPELIVAGILFLLAVLVITDSLRIGIGWSDEGPRSGYFPFYIGLALLASSAWIGAKQLLNWSKNDGFAERGQLALVWAIFWPMVVYVGLVAALGIYVASVILIGFFMIRHGKHKVVTAAAVAVGVPLGAYLIFERWFLVQLPKGPLEALVGL